MTGHIQKIQSGRWVLDVEHYAIECLGYIRRLQRYIRTFGVHIRRFKSYIRHFRSYIRKTGPTT